MIEAPPASSYSLFGFQDPYVYEGVGEPFSQGGLWEERLKLGVCGGVFSAKTTAAAIRHTMQVLSFPGMRMLILVPDRELFHRNILPVLQEVHSWFGMVEGEDWEYFRPPRSEILYKISGVQCWVYTAEKKVFGSTVGAAWIDEAGEIPHERWLEVIERTRQPGYPKQIQATFTGEGDLHWTTQVFFQDDWPEDARDTLQFAPKRTGEEGRGRYMSFRAKTADNPYGGAEHAADLMDAYGGPLTPLARRKLLGDPHATLNTLTYDMWDEDYYVVPEERWPGKPKWIFAGEDFAGSRTPSAITVWGIDEEGRWYGIDEFYSGHMEPVSMAAEAKRLRKQHGIRTFWADSANPEWIRPQRRLGLGVRLAYKRIGAPGDFSAGIGLVSAVLNKKGPDGEQKVFISPKMKMTIREFGSYVFDDPKDPTHHEPSAKPRQVGDHAMDASRYCITGMYRLGYDKELRALQDRTDRLRRGIPLRRAS